MVSLKGKLGHLKRHMQLEPERKIVKQEIKTTENVIPHLEQWEKLGARPHWFDGHYTMIREVSYHLLKATAVIRLASLQRWSSVGRSIRLAIPYQQKESKQRICFFLIRKRLD